MQQGETSGNEGAAGEAPKPPRGAGEKDSHEGRVYG